MITPWITVHTVFGYFSNNRQNIFQRSQEQNCTGKTSIHRSQKDSDKSTPLNEDLEETAEVLHHPHYELWKQSLYEPKSCSHHKCCRNESFKNKFLFSALR